MAAATDPLLANSELGYSEEFYPYGFPALVASNSPEVIEAARFNWGDVCRVWDARPLEMRILIEPGGQGCPPVPAFRARKNLLAAVADAGNFWCADLQEGFGSAWLSASTLQHPGYICYHVLEGMAYSMLDALRVVLIHAACVARNGRGALLAGDSGAGKSSLAYACARRGWSYCSDDASALVRCVRDRVVMGNPRTFRFRASAGSLFPEFRGMRVSSRTGGKPTIEAPLSSLPAIRTAHQVSVDCVFFLKRQTTACQAAQVEPVAPEEGFERLMQCPWPNDLSVRAEHEAALRRLLGARLFELRYRELDAAVELLETLVGCEADEQLLDASQPGHARFAAESKF
jgi:hypothetical protein